MSTPCPKCQSAETRYRVKRTEWICDDCDHRWTPEGERPRQPLRIFLSYGHDEHTATALRIKADLEARGHKVWFDIERLAEGRDWEQYIEEGLATCDKVVLLMTPYSVRRRKSRDPESRDGYCLNEIAKAMEKNKLIVPVLLVGLDDGPPASICRIQYLDLRDSVPIAEHEEQYKLRLERLAKAVEEDDLDFEGGQARLARLLRPLSFDAEMSRHIASFTGRVWLLAELDAWLDRKSGSRVFWLMGGPGIGKTAVATHLCHFRPEVVGYHFCTHGHSDKGDPAAAVVSIAYQMAQHLPEYARRLGEKDLEKDVAKNAGTLFDNLIVEPLGRDFPAPHGDRLVVIDALDEATNAGRNAIAELIRDHWGKTPAWLRLVITSRPELEVVSTLGHLDPYTLDAQRAENLDDLEQFLKREIEARRMTAAPALLRTILDKSEGVFLYARVLFDEIDAKRLTLDHPEDLPAGLYGHYHRFFSRQLPDVDRYRGELRPLLEIACAGRAPVPVALLARALGAGGFEVRERLMRLGSLLNLRQSDRKNGDGDTVALFHKSVRDWLTAIDEKARMPVAGPYVIDGERGEKALANAVATELKADVARASAYALRYGPGHLQAAGRATEAAEFMTEFGYHHARLERLGANDVAEVARDFAEVIQARLSEEWRDRGKLWQRFYNEIAHLLRRPGIRPEIELMQKAYAHADESPVSRCVEAWLDEHPPSAWWFRKIGRPRFLVRNACLRVLEGHTNWVSSVALHPDGRRAITTSGGEPVRVWDLETVWDLDMGACLRTLEGTSNSLVLHPDGRRLVTGSSDSMVRVWDLQTGACLTTLTGHAGLVASVALYADGQRAVSGSYDQTLRMWNLDTGECQGAWLGVSSFWAIALATPLPSGRARIAAGCGDGSVHFFELMPPGPLTRTTVATWSPTTSLVATAVDSGAVVLHQWHATSAHLEEIARSAPFPTTVASLHFSLDGTRLQVLFPDGTERILDATNLQPASPPSGAWSPPRLTNPDNAWRAEIVDGRLRIVAPGQAPA